MQESGLLEVIYLRWRKSSSKYMYDKFGGTTHATPTRPQHVKTTTTERPRDELGLRNIARNSTLLDLAFQCSPSSEGTTITQDRLEGANVRLWVDFFSIDLPLY